MDYYKNTIYIAQVDENNNIIGGIERWEAHRKGILHRALTVAIKYKDCFVLQHRKHPVFDGIFDLTSSSHQIYKDGKLQDTVEAVYNTLEREWGLEKKDVTVPQNHGTIYYKAPDTKSEFIEHEYCEILSVEIKQLRQPQYDFAYGFSLVKKDELLKPNTRLHDNLAPWVLEAIKEEKI